MPTRILREGILTSPRVNSLSANAELFYRRLMSVTDDYGRYFGNETLLRAACYPFQVDRVNEASISKHLAECVGARLIVLYTINGTAYLQMLDTRQQTRSKSKYPEPPSELLSKCEADAKQMESKRESVVLVVGDGDGDGDGTRASRLPVGLKTLTELGVEEQHAKDWLKVRKAKRAPLTQTVIDDIRAQAGKAGISFPQAIAICAKKSWQGFNADWDWGEGGSRAKKLEVV